MDSGAGGEGATRLRLRAFVGSLDGQMSVRDELSGATEDPEALGRDLAARLLERGADRILGAVRGADAGPPPQLT